MANDMVMKDIPVTDLIHAEEGGRGEVRVQALPGRGRPVADPEDRRASPDWDIEACGGTHARTHGRGRVHQDREDREGAGWRRTAGVRGRIFGRGVRPEMDATINQVSSLLGDPAGERTQGGGDREDRPGAVARAAKSRWARSSSPRPIPGDTLVCDRLKGGRLYISGGGGRWRRTSSTTARRSTASLSART